MSCRKFPPLALLSLLLALGSNGASAADTVISAVTEGRPLVDIRFRVEDVNQANKPKEATATTIRARLGYETAELKGFTLLGEFDAVGHIGPEHFNNTLNGLTDYPTIADPDMFALNRLQLSYRFRLANTADKPPDLQFIVGRQRIFFGDGRFIGNAEWRQHEQTFDALTIADTSFRATTLTYSYVAQVNRVFGPDSPMGTFDSHSHLFNAVYAGLLPNLKLEGYAYLLDLHEAPTLSRTSIGLRAESAFDLGSGFGAKLNGAYAYQTDYANNPLSIGLAYYLAEAQLTYAGFTGLAGYDVFEGDGVTGFQTPLANLHPFEGWAEVFISKPPEGLKDLYFRGGYGVPIKPYLERISALVAHHDFSAEHISADYGSEWDAQLEGQISNRLVLDLAYADYQGAGPFPDKRVFWAYATYRY